MYNIVAGRAYDLQSAQPDKFNTRSHCSAADCTVCAVLHVPVTMLTTGNLHFVIIFSPPPHLAIINVSSVSQFISVLFVLFLNFVCSLDSTYE